MVGHFSSSPYPFLFIYIYSSRGKFSQKKFLTLILIIMFFSESFCLNFLIEQMLTHVFFQNLPNWYGLRHQRHPNKQWLEFWMVGVGKVGRVRGWVISYLFI